MKCSESNEPNLDSVASSMRYTTACALVIYSKQITRDLLQVDVRKTGVSSGAERKRIGWPGPLVPVLFGFRVVMMEAPERSLSPPRGHPQHPVHKMVEHLRMTPVN